MSHLNNKSKSIRHTLDGLGGILIITSFLLDKLYFDLIIVYSLVLVGITIIGSINFALFIGKRYKENHDLMIGIGFGILSTFILGNFIELYHAVIMLFVLPPLFGLVTVENKLEQSIFSGSFYVGRVLLGMIEVAVVLGIIFGFIGSLILGQLFDPFFSFVFFFMITVLIIFKYFENKLKKYMDDSKKNLRAYGFLGGDIGMMIGVISWFSLFSISYTQYTFSLNERSILLLVGVIVGFIIGYFGGYISKNKGSFT